MQDNLRSEHWKIRCALILHSMSLKTYTSVEEIPDDLPITYFQKGYYLSQVYANFVAYSNDNYFIPFDIIQDKAISIPRSPFGSFVRRNISDGRFDQFHSLEAELQKRGVKEIEIHHPSQIYGEFIPQHIIEESGFKSIYVDINQHIDVSQDWEASIHNMQKRKLESLKKEGFEFRKMEADEFETAHQFLSVCRQAQGLQINISWEQLNTLTQRLPNTYDCFGVFREDRISALCIAVCASKDVVYYYLPATSPMFRDKSPMVLLIAGMVSYYRNEGFKYFDLGVSSLKGIPQETLRIFKERMGAIETAKPTFLKSL